MGHHERRQPHTGPSETDARDRHDVVVVGSLNVDVVVRTHELPRPGETVIATAVEHHPGGKGLNQAVAARRAGATVAMVGAVGDDADGRMLRDIVRTEGIDDRHLVTIDHQPTGRAHVVVDSHGENIIVVVPGANAHLAIASLPAARVVLAQCEVPTGTARAAMRNARRNGALALLNPAPAHDLPAELLGSCDILIPNEHELESLPTPAALFDAGVRHLIVTKGSSGVERLSPHDAEHTPAIPVRAVDTTGAGDAFCGALAAQLADGANLADSIRFATAAGALATTRRGAVAAQPRREQIVELLTVDEPG